MSRRVLLYAVTAAAWLAFAGWLHRDYLRRVAAERAALRARGEAILVALESGIRAMARAPFGRRAEHLKAALDALMQKLVAERDALREQGKPVPKELESRLQMLPKLKGGPADQLRASLEELVRHPAVLGVAIVDREGRTIVSAGITGGDTDERPVSPQDQWRDGMLLLTRAVDVSRFDWLFCELRSMAPSGMRQRSRRAGPRRGRWAEAWGQTSSPGGPPGPRFSDREREKAPGPVYARLAMSQGELADVAREHLRMALTAGAIGLLAAAGVALAWHVSLRNREQAAALQTAEAQNQHLREMQLAGAGLAHEIKNPLNVLRGTAQSLLANGSQAGDEGLRRMLDETDRVVSRLNSFLSFSRVPTPELTKVDATRLVQQVAELVGHGVDHQDAKIEVQPLPSIEADPELFRQMVFNLVHNAVRATADGGAVRIAAVPQAASRVTMEIADTGTGVPEPMREQLFRPYCSGWEGGTGLGLSIVRQIALAHGWRVGYRPNSNAGSTFWIAGIKTRQDPAEHDPAPGS